MMVFGAAGIIYLIVNGLLTLLMRLVERKRWPSSDVASTWAYCIKSKQQGEISLTLVRLFYAYKNI